MNLCNFGIAPSIGSQQYFCLTARRGNRERYGKCWAGLTGEYIDSYIGINHFVPIILTIGPMGGVGGRLIPYATKTTQSCSFDGSNL